MTFSRTSHLKFRNTQSNAIHSKDHILWSSWFHSRDTIFNIWKSTNVIQHINRIRIKISWIISIDSEKAFDKIKYLFMIKVLNKSVTEGSYLNVIKDILDKLITNIILNWKIKLKRFPVTLGTQSCPFSSLLFYVVLEILTRAKK
jgi:hypothetical protein